VLVMKFGGSSVADAERICRAATLAAEAARSPEAGGKAPVVVVSALGGVTDRLFALARAALGGRAAQAETLSLVDDLRLHHEKTLRGVAPDGDAVAEARVAAYFVELHDIVVGVSLLGELSPRSLDAVTSYGEKLSVQLFAAALRALGTPALGVSAEDVVVTDATFGAALPDMAATTARAAMFLAVPASVGQLPVVTGYIGATPDGVTTTLGRNGSDYSAAIVGAALGATEVWIWTDVDGVMSADPRLVPHARSLPRLDYVETSELAYFGSKVIHPRTIVPAVSAGVPIRIKNTFNPTHPGTLITEDRSSAAGAVKAVTMIRALALVTVQGLGMLGVPGIAARTLATVARTGVNVLMISQSSSESNIALIVPQTDVDNAVAALRDEFAPELRRHDVEAVSAASPMAILTVVGAGMRGQPGVAGRFFGALGRAGINVSAIAQGSSEYSISCVVHDGDAAIEGLRAVHDEFIIAPTGAIATSA